MRLGCIRQGSQSQPVNDAGRARSVERYTVVPGLALADLGGSDRGPGLGRAPVQPIHKFESVVPIFSSHNKCTVNSGAFIV